MKFVGAISSKLPNGLLETNVCKTLESLNEVHFNHFYPWLFYFQRFQVILLFQASKAQDNIQS